MRTITPKQRAAIYLKAAEIIFNGKGEFCCCVLSEIQHNDPGMFNIKEYPEFLKFKPKYLLGEVWWLSDSEYHVHKNTERDQRIIALLLCHWMAKDAEK